MNCSVDTIATVNCTRYSVETLKIFSTLLRKLKLLIIILRITPRKMLINCTQGTTDNVNRIGNSIEVVIPIVKSNEGSHDLYSGSEDISDYFSDNSNEDT